MEQQQIHGAAWTVALVAGGLLVAALAAGCTDMTIINNNDSQGGQGGVGGSSSANPVFTAPTSPTTPTTPVTPTPNVGIPTPGIGYRTPDPAVGSVLPFPTYGASIAATIDGNLATMACFENAYLDQIVLALRKFDTRWGYVCKRGNCADVSRDAIGYHAAAGPETIGASGMWVVDIVLDVCGLAHAQWLVLGYDAVAAWTSRGRF